MSRENNHLELTEKFLIPVGLGSECMARTQNFSKGRCTEPWKGHFFSNIYQKEIETKRIRKEIKTIISRLKHFLSFLSNIVEKKLKQEYWKGNQNKKYLVLST